MLYHWFSNNGGGRGALNHFPLLFCESVHINDILNKSPSGFPFTNLINPIPVIYSLRENRVKMGASRDKFQIMSVNMCSEKARIQSSF